MVDSQGRIPPQSMEAEKAVLGACLLNRDAIYSALEYVRPADFYRREHQTIFDCMIELNDRRLPVDMVMVMEQLQKKGLLEMAGGVDYLAGLTTEVPSAETAAYYAQIVADKALQRALVDGAQGLVDDGFPARRMDWSSWGMRKALSRILANANCANPSAR